MAAAVTRTWKDRRLRTYQSVFQTDIQQPTPYSTPSLAVPEEGQPFGGPVISLTQHQDGSAPTTLTPTQHAPVGPGRERDAAEDQIAYDRAWHVVTSRIVLPSSASAEDSFGSLPAESQYVSQGLPAGSESEFYEALSLVLNSAVLLPLASHTEDVFAWHMQQVRRHFSQHVLPLLSACAGDIFNEEGEENEDVRRRGDSYERHMIVVMSSIRTIEAALRLYSYGFQLLIRGVQRVRNEIGGLDVIADPAALAVGFRRDVHALVGNSASQGLMRSLRAVLVHLIGGILGISSGDASDGNFLPGPSPGPVRLSEDDLNSLAARKRLFELIGPLNDVGLAGERFQILFADVMDDMMSAYIRNSYAGQWTLASTEKPDSLRPLEDSPITGSKGGRAGPTSHSISTLSDWIENHFSRLVFEVLYQLGNDSAQRGKPPVTLADVKMYQSLALSRLATLRTSELFDIVLAWPSSRGALDDLRVAINTPQRRLQLTESFSASMERRLLHPGRSTLEILRTYIAIIRTFHALDNTKVLLSRVVPSLQLYLCSREDAVRIVVTGLLASPEEIKAATATLKEQQGTERRDTASGAEAGWPETPSLLKRTSAARQVGRGRDSGTRSRGQDIHDDATGTDTALPDNKLVELAVLMRESAQSRRILGPDDDADLDWNDMQWVPDPIDAGANYKRPRSEDVIGTLISTLGSPDVFIREFQVIVAERLLSDQARFDQEIRVLNLLKKRFGESALQNCDVMIKDIHDSRRLDAAIRALLPATAHEQSRLAATPAGPRRTGAGDFGEKTPAPYHARILSRLFWPNLEREHFLIPEPILEDQKRYEEGFERLKSSRKLTWLNQLGQATVELEFQDRSATVNCKTYEATVIYAFQQPEEDTHPQSSHAQRGRREPARRSVGDLADQLQMDDDLVLAALNFWVSKGVLRKSQGDTYTVIESLSSDADLASGQPSSPPGAAAGVTAEGQKQQQQYRPSGASGVDEKEQARRQMYWQYIKGMLTNASATMPLAQMAMMMRMLIADGFPWSNEELQEFLSEKVAEGELEVVVGKYKLVRK
ncbi:hypothetical protein VTK73DRAFT_2799 [Phialemonium thermophilum]|uniref:Anaphase-promoting complex subunit 2 n=1 Tax=Phialemonium thermophilum TaxID=223376 RepID=A0ABR3X328_9PEZI